MNMLFSNNLISVLCFPLSNSFTSSNKNLLVSWSSNTYFLKAFESAHFFDASTLSLLFPCLPHSLEIIYEKKWSNLWIIASHQYQTYGFEIIASFGRRLTRIWSCSLAACLWGSGWWSFTNKYKKAIRICCFIRMALHQIVLALQPCL